MKRKSKFLCLLIAVCVSLSLAVLPNAVRADASAFESEHWIESSASALTEKRNAGDVFVSIYYSEICFSSGPWRLFVEEWMNEYGIDVYGVDTDEDEIPIWVWAGLSGRSVTLPVICVTDGTSYACFSGKDSTRAIQERVRESLQIENYREIGFHTLDEQLFQAYARNGETVRNAFLSDRSGITEEIVALSDEITAGKMTNEAKLRAVYDWVTENLYYDHEMASGMRRYRVSAEYTIENRSSVCTGFADLTDALCDAAGIPCRVVTGYALGLGAESELRTVWGIYKDWLENGDSDAFGAEMALYANHAWNEAYLNGRWLILDTTWGCTNDYYASQEQYLKGQPEPEYYDPVREDFFATHLFWEAYPEMVPVLTMTGLLPEKNAEEITAESEFCFAALYDENGRFLSFSESELFGRQAFAVLPPDDEATSGKFFFLRADGSPVWSMAGEMDD